MTIRYVNEKILFKALCYIAPNLFAVFLGPAFSGAQGTLDLESVVFLYVSMLNSIS